MKLSALVLCLMALSASADERPIPSMTCKPVGREVQCAANNVDDLWPKWVLLKTGANYIQYGPDFKYPAPKRWSVLEMTVSDGERLWTMRIEVRHVRGVARIRPYTRELPDLPPFATKGAR